MKDQFIRINIKQEVKIEIQQKNTDIWSNQTSLELIDYLFYFIEIKMRILRALKLEDVIYQKA